MFTAYWMENVRDWCISRQLWWGQRIPAWYLPDGQVVVEETAENALAAAQKIDPSLTAADLRQDEDVLDTWFSSWLWPISVFDPKLPGHPEHKPNRDLSYYYPTSDLVTGPDIIFFWVARMIMAGDEFMHDVPFRNVYFTGIVRDKIGRKMSKTLGNSPNPLDLIAKYGADAVRLGMLLCTSAGNDILYDESQVEQGRNFCAKIWNAWRLVSGWNVDAAAQQPEAAREAVKWFDNLLSRTIETVEDHLYETVLLGLGSEVGVFVAGHGFTGKSLLEVLLGLGAGQRARLVFIHKWVVNRSYLFPQVKKESRKNKGIIIFV